jgi:hypothetical protein
MKTMKTRLVKRLLALGFLLFVVGLVMPAAAGRSEAPPETDQSTTGVGQQAATLWYHPHLIPTTAEQVYRGLAGMMGQFEVLSTELF